MIEFVRNWLEIQIEGAGLGIGTRVAVKASGLPAQWQRVHTDSSYLSASDPRVHFGLGDATTVDEIEVLWPAGKKQVVRGPIKVNRLLTIREP